MSVVFDGRKKVADLVSSFLKSAENLVRDLVADQFGVMQFVHYRTGVLPDTIPAVSVVEL